MTGPQQQTVFDQRGQQVGTQHNIAGDFTQERGDTITMSGDFRGAIVNLKSTLKDVSQTIGAIPHASADEKQKLEAWLTQLTAALEQTLQAHPESQEAVETVAETAKTLVEQANKDKPNRSLLNVTGEGLIKAAENLARLTPPVLAISKQLVAFVLGLATRVG